MRPFIATVVGRALRRGTFACLSLSLSAALWPVSQAEAQACVAREGQDAELEALLRSDPAVSALVDNAERHRLQVVVGRLEQDAAGNSCLRWFRFRDGAQYFYAAGAMHLPMAMAVMQQLDEGQGLWDVNATLVSDGVRADSQTASLGNIRIAHAFETTIDREMRRMVILSTNQAFNRLFDLLGLHEIADRMLSAQLNETRLNHRFDESVPIADNVHAPGVRIVIGGAPRVFFPPRSSAPAALPFPWSDALVGEAHIPIHAPDEPTPEPIDEPFDFAVRNYASLTDLLRMMLELGAPELLDVAGFSLSPTSRAYLAYLFSRGPQDLGIDGIDTEAWTLQRFKPMWDGIATVREPATLTYLSHAGRAFGFHTDVAFVRDESTGAGFVVAATIYANQDDVLNDDRYEYTQVTEPFFESLGALLAQWSFAAIE
jgi:hypothetical protein